VNRSPNPVIESPTVFSDEELRAHRNLKTPLCLYLQHSRLLAALSAPLIYLCLIPFLLLDILISLYQAICFPIYGIPRVQRARYFIFDRGRLMYLNGLERLNCIYCSYANGLIAYTAEIAGRTEQHWCPIKHAHEIPAQHSRYEHFLTYGDAAAYRGRLEEVRVGFHDLKS
jgi:hypothetical protein